MQVVNSLMRPCSSTTARLACIERGHAALAMAAYASMLPAWQGQSMWVVNLQDQLILLDATNQHDYIDLARLKSG
jgi:hypothetical protein